MKIAQLKTMANREPIASICLTIKENKGSQTRGSKTVNTYVATDGEQDINIDVFGEKPIYQEGDFLMLKSPVDKRGRISAVAVNSYQGKTSITCWDNAIIEIIPMSNKTAEPPAANQATVANHNPSTPKSNNGTSSLQELVHLWADATQAYFGELLKRGYSREEALSLSVQAPSFIPLYWFGQKEKYQHLLN